MKIKNYQIDEKCLFCHYFQRTHFEQYFREDDTAVMVGVAAG